MGFKNAPRCAACLSAGWTGSPSQFRDSVLACIRLRPCYQEAWNWANCEAGLSEDELPSLGFEPRNAQNDRDDSIPAADAAWDAGDQGCGELALELRMRLERLKPGEVLLLTTRDLGAPQDVPAWCGLTGHALLREAVPHYWIRRAD
ncbi:MAG: sulfurtransferase TusA family protein [Verrucomicrobia bacterium]|nr:sulfurtransferase TusA family protein [Verrucomicrobiota bacterium]MBI3868551.1 sulfurtransferase TusA family protein [Verrucomicrobiota bacterium]